uniref:DUF4172 domain-containing protein n=1 Tax=Thiolapillus sp. TaxID=2017437 RepID=UPI003AF6B6BC
MRNAKWVWQRSDWPNFQYEEVDFTETCGEFTAVASRLAGRIEALSELPRQEITVDLMVSEAIKTMEIEGERLD